MSPFVLRIVFFAVLALSSSQAFAQTLELGMPRDSVLRKWPHRMYVEGDASRIWDVEIAPVVFADLSGTYWLGFDKSNRLEYIQFHEHVGDRLPSDVWTRIVNDFKKRKLASLKEEHELIGDTYRWKNGDNNYTLTNTKGFLSYTATAPSAMQNPKRRLK